MINHTAHVVCPGPSLDAPNVPWHNSDELLLVVNSAVRFVPDSRCTFYLVANDGPIQGDLLSTTAIPRLIELGRPSVVTVSQNASAWAAIMRELAPELSLLIVEHEPDEPTEWMRDAVRIPGRRDDQPIRASMLTAIGYAASQHATEIVLHGVDLADDGDRWYADAEVSAVQQMLNNVRDPGHEYTKLATKRRANRFERERVALTRVIAAAADHGITIRHAGTGLRA